jgi:hypothetical protein
MLEQQEIAQSCLELWSIFLEAAAISVERRGVRLPNNGPHPG